LKAIVEVAEAKPIEENVQMVDATAEDEGMDGD
jgi:hypothetical protein